MKTMILAGGFGTRLSEEMRSRPKPMVEIRGCPILCHIMKIYSHCRFYEFFISLGYSKIFHMPFIKILNLFKQKETRYYDVEIDFKDA